MLLFGGGNFFYVFQKQPTKICHFCHYLSLLSFLKPKNRKKSLQFQKICAKITRFVLFEFSNLPPICSAERCDLVKSLNPFVQITPLSLPKRGSFSNPVSLEKTVIISAFSQYKNKKMRQKRDALKRRFGNRWSDRDPDYLLVPEPRSNITRFPNL